VTPRGHGGQGRTSASCTKSTTRSGSAAPLCDASSSSASTRTSNDALSRASRSDDSPPTGESCLRKWHADPSDATQTAAANALAALETNAAVADAGGPCMDQETASVRDMVGNSFCPWVFASAGRLSPH
jgi:hypothetical protein